ncbi:molybdopterin biosynthesis protein [Thermosulfuriphilus ammonigenes]|uniref:Molybdopterin molybdenumtransferase n=1 Tax=Thermosulfuriphilus ammonigenes TaxID=1936021 RepID=A0A6G7PUA3_9BACT|nr:molybdopterin biosynthesis protein [Thermosulfuriphilus ammonigenes]MBA2848770.1 putative molybdopterin biosynthesis protein [Thermosulfuriphilus ammonigenes]QIJ71101.1 molybdopterin biosynthesis protein [Thermosulfuriphilus ammonigenes]
MKERRIYLRMKSLDEARNLFLRALPDRKILKTEEIPVSEARGRVTADPIFARLSSPPFNAAAMDGVAVRAEETFGASETTPLILRLGEEAIFVNTGEPLPSGKNAVIMVEHLHFVDEERVEIRSPAYPWQHVRKVGEDIVSGELLFTEGHRLTPWDLGALLAAGHIRVRVRQRPRVTIIPTGDELLSPEEAQKGLPPGKVIEFNSQMLAAMVEEWGGQAEIWPLVPDDLKALRKTISKAVKTCHLLVIIAGSSAGSRDFTAGLVEEMGELLVHGVTIMPGKPVVLGLIEKTPVMGIPGYPVSAVVAFEVLGRQAIQSLLGTRLPERVRLRAFSGRKIPSRLGIEEFIRVKVGEVSGKRVFLPLKRGAGAITTLTRADGLVRIPADSEGVLAGEGMEVELLRPEKDLGHCILAVGSHDLALELLGQFLRRHYPEMELSSAHVGSLSGLMALRDGLAHLAGSHLFDPQSGTFNLPYIEKYLPQTPVRVVHFASRSQGLIVPPGNPRGIRSLKDVAQKGLTFINRQPGSGTRVLLDYHLQDLGINPGEIKGYDQEETTHLGVAVAVATGQAEVGLGIMAAARALGLDFIPLFEERYDLVVRKEFFESRLFKRLYKILKSPEFAKAVSALGGYGVKEMGDIIL